jgi:PIN domain
MITLYVETNFILQIGYSQDTWESSEFLLHQAESGKLKLVVPAYSLIEGLASFENTDTRRKRLSRELNKEIGQLRRTKKYETLADDGSLLASLFVAKNEEDTKALAKVVERLLNWAEIEPLTLDIVALSRSYVSKPYDLSPQDAAVLASVWTHLNRGGTGKKWFVSADKKGFDDPDIRDMLKKFDCDVLHKFDEAKELFETL